MEPRNCDGHDNVPELAPGPIQRRDFFKLGIGGALSLALASRLTLEARAEEPSSGKGKGKDTQALPPLVPKAKSIVLLWMDGGMSQMDTFDPKQGANGGGLKKIGTKIPGVQFTEPLAPLADLSDRIAVIRSMTSREGNHQRARYLLHTGYPPTGTLKHPSTGAIVSLKKQNAELDIPHFVAVNNPSFGAGFLGVNYGPFVIQDPSRPPDNVAYAAGIDADRFDRRLKLVEKVDQGFTAARAGLMTDGKDSIYEKSVKLMRSPLLKAFDVNAEPEAVRKAYGIGDGMGGSGRQGNAARGDKFAEGVLMARRLVEVGVPFVEVTLGGWDTHEDGETRVTSLANSMAPAFAALVRDLEDRNLLDSTLVLCMGEFGRTPRINARDGRDHFPGCFSVAMAGGGVKGGQAIGRTTDDGMSVAGTGIEVPDLMATICTAIGIDHTEWFQTPVGRPIQIANKGRLIEGLLQ
ncbi:MAG: DUF1501 domain-containing protein [Candidatus Brocadiae bacterium]|nr:DUF1501 domain-containing protein [Candidatus Brocadiia bacterium]